MLRNLRWLLVLVGLALTADRAWGLGEILGETKEQLKLDYHIDYHDHGNGRATIEFTLADEGRLKPLTAVQLTIPAQEKEKDGGYYMDMVVNLELKPSEEGKRVARFEMRKDWMARAEIHLVAYSFDGKQLPMTHYIHVIPLAPSMKTPPVEKRD